MDFGWPLRATSGGCFFAYLRPIEPVVLEIRIAEEHAFQFGGLQRTLHGRDGERRAENDGQQSHCADAKQVAWDSRQSKERIGKRVDVNSMKCTPLKTGLNLAAVSYYRWQRTAVTEARSSGLGVTRV